jgi:hypothetical protein
MNNRRANEQTPAIPKSKNQSILVENGTPSAQEKRFNQGKDEKASAISRKRGSSQDIDIIERDKDDRELLLGSKQNIPKQSQNNSRIPSQESKVSKIKSQQELEISMVKDVPSTGNKDGALQRVKSGDLQNSGVIKTRVKKGKVGDGLEKIPEEAEDKNKKNQEEEDRIKEEQEREICRQLEILSKSSYAPDGKKVKFCAQASSLDFFITLNKY